MQKKRKKLKTSLKVDWEYFKEACIDETYFNPFTYLYSLLITIIINVAFIFLPIYIFIYTITVLTHPYLDFNLFSYQLSTLIISMMVLPILLIWSKIYADYYEKEEKLRRMG